MVFILPNLKSIFCVGNVCTRYSYVLFLIIPVVLIILFLMRKDFVKFKSKKEQDSYREQRRNIRIILIITRSLLFVSLLIAIASPFVVQEKLIVTEPTVLLLVDNSSSFGIYDNSVADELYGKLHEKIKVEMKHIASGISSPIGDSILNNMQGDDNLLLITDGQSNKGKLLGDVISFASNLNSSVYTVDIQPVKSDVSVSVEGTSQIIADSEESFVVKINNVGKELSYTVEVTADDVIVLSTQSKGASSFSISSKFPVGYHKITAKVLPIGEDAFVENNIFYKSVKVVDRPRILFVTEKSSPLFDALNKFYVVDSVTAIPNDLNPYLAIIVNDIPAQKLNPKVDALTSFIADGNGLIVVGGQNSYERGGYKSSLFETLLPVRTGVGEESEKSDVNIVIVIDISSGTENYVDVEKALAISVLDSLAKENNVGVVAFNDVAYEVGRIKPLKEHYEDMKNKISKLKFDSQSNFDRGMKGAANMLKDVSGSKNIIFISDGKTTNQKLKDASLDLAANLGNTGVKIYTVGVGERRDDEFMYALSIAGNGIYFPVDASNKLKILFGDPNTKKEAEYFNKLIILDSTHFITFNTSLDASVNGYNLVVPKPSARPIIVNNKNIPIVVVSRFGLGRIVALATDDGSKWSGELLNRDNSKLLTKTINWAIGDLSRKKEFDVAVKDTFIGEEGNVLVTAKEPPKSDSKSGLVFVKTNVGTYSADFIPQKEGFGEILGAVFAVNYPEEYKELGTNPEFIELVKASGGEVFNPDDADKIVESIKKTAKRIKTTEVDYRFIFVVFVIVMFLAEIGVRRFVENKKASG